MATANVIDNPGFKDDDSLKSVEYRSMEQHPLVGLESNPVKNFAQQFTGRSYFVLKLINVFLLLILGTVFAVCPGALYISWNYVFDYSNGMMNGASIFLWTMFGLAALSTAVYWQLKKTVDTSKFLLSCIAIADFWLSALFVLTLSTILVLFVIDAARELLLFVPRLSNPEMELAEFTGYAKYRRENVEQYRPYYWNSNEYKTTTEQPRTTTYSPDELGRMKKQRVMILVRLVVDCFVPIFALLAIALQLLFMWRIRRSIKATNLWISDYAQAFPNASAFDKGYGGSWVVNLIKLINWVIPTVMLVFLFQRYTQLDPLSIVGGCWAAFFAQWLYYLRKARFHSDEELKARSLMNHCKLDCALSSVGFLVYLCLYNSGYVYRYDEIGKLSALAMLVLLCHMVNNGRLLYNASDKSGMKFNCLPNISFNFSINVIKQGQEKDMHKETEGVEADLKQNEEKEESEKNLYLHV